MHAAEVLVDGLDHPEGVACDLEEAIDLRGVPLHYPERWGMDA